MTTLRSKLIRLAHQKPELRSKLLPLLTREAVDEERLRRLVEMGDPEAREQLEAVERRKSIRGVLPVGKTIDTRNGTRVHRYNNAIVVTNLTNAGKRGKKVDRFSLYDIDMVRNPDVLSAVEGFGATTLREDYVGALKAAKSLLGLAESLDLHYPKLDERQLRGVDVPPASRKPIKFQGAKVQGTISSNDFHLVDRTDRFNEMTLIPGERAKKTSTARFYAWASSNLDELYSMSLREIASLMTKMKVSYHQYAAMD